MPVRVVILIKLPGLLPVKTRLVPLLGEEGARALFVEMLEATVDLARRFDPDPTIAYSPPEGDPRAALPSLAGCTFLPVEGGDGAVCLENALAAAGEDALLIALGGDAPDLPAGLLREVIDRLRDHDAVFVPTRDGGFSCLGLRRSEPGLAGGFHYGAGDSLERLHAFLESRGRSVHLTAPWPDVDTPDDYRAYLERSAGRQALRRGRADGGDRGGGSAARDFSRIASRFPKLPPMDVHDSVLDVIGETPLVRLRRVTEGIACRVYAKLENMNPGGSIKDRIGSYMVEKAEKAGLLKPGGIVVESTSGNTGVGLAVTCAVKGYGLIVTMPDKMSQEKINLIRGYGGKVVVTPTAVEYGDPRHYVQTAMRIAEETPNSVYIDQFNNPDNPEAHFTITGPEIERQLGGRLDAFVVSMGTGGTLTGAGKYLKEKLGSRIVGADPEGSIYAGLLETGEIPATEVYAVEGIGHDYVPGTCDVSVLDEVVTVSDKASFQMARRLAREEGIFCGGSSGTNVVAALKIAMEMPAEAVVVVVICDTGERYLSKQWNDDWMRDNQFLEESSELTALGIVSRRARDLEPLIAIGHEASVREAIQLMRAHDLSQLPVRRDADLVGCISENQAIDLLYHRDDLEAIPVEQVMGPALPVLPGETPAEEIASRLTRGQKAVLVDRGGGELVIVTKFDLIRAGTVR